VLCSVTTREENRDSPHLQALIRRQLPLIEKRLSQTLAKLERPIAADETYISARAWWESLARQYRGEGVEFDGPKPAAGTRLPRSLFASAADNLIRNALGKREAESGIRVRVTLECNERVVLRVCDTGSAVPDAVAANLLRMPIASSRGLGIGLYQAARHAESSGYRLVLETNRDGEVCFTLTGPPQPA
jgi:signal transduction histidine kinase